MSNSRKKFGNLCSNCAKPSITAIITMSYIETLNLKTFSSISNTNNISLRNSYDIRDGSLKLCDFGFARILPQKGADLTDYVATRWYFR